MPNDVRDSNMKRINNREPADCYTIKSDKKVEEHAAELENKGE